MADDLQDKRRAQAEESSVTDALWLRRFRMICATRAIRQKAARAVGRDLAKKSEPLYPKPPPKIIWTYWKQGWDEAPELVKACLQSWRERNPGWQVHALSDADYHAYVEIDEALMGKEIGVAHFADVMRVNLLNQHGGVWVDATLLCARPLESWLPLMMTSGFFAFSRPFPDRMISNWFLASTPRSAMMERWTAATMRYWRLSQKADHYSWQHLLFETLYADDAVFRAAWDNTPHLSADPAHIVQFALKGEISDAFAAQALASGATPVHKLSWKIDAPLERAMRLTGAQS